MTNLYETYLPLVQSLNDYGGNISTIHIRRAVLDAIDAGVANEPTLAGLRDKLASKMAQWTGLQDHTTFSEFFEAYYEAVFYLLARHRGVPLSGIPASSKKGQTPDFTTLSEPAVNFEVKTIDIADPNTSYDKMMAEGLDTRIALQAEARRRGVASAARIISPHGSAKNRLEAVEQVMKKIDSNVSAGQYRAAPTFLVVSTARVALHDDAVSLRKFVPEPAQAQPASGQLYAIAAHEVGDAFYFSKEWAHNIENLGPLNRAGILRDHEYIAGLIFLSTKRSARNSPEPVASAFALNGIWNTRWAKNNGFGPAATAVAKREFERLCNAWNDTEDSRCGALPTP